MKLRTKGNSLRFRVTRSEVAKLLASGQISEVIHFSPEDQPCLRYTLKHEECRTLRVECAALTVTVVIPSDEIRQWANSDQVGIYRNLDIGRNGELEVSVEKDFGCLDLPEKDQEDMFPNPNAGIQC